MPPELKSFITFLSILWFLVYWIMGGVFFAVVSITRWGRLHRVTFSCLFSLLALACGIGAAWGGVRLARGEVTHCLAQAENRAEAITAIFGCGFVGIFGVFLIGAAVLVIGGFIIMALASTKEAQPWLALEEKSLEETQEEKQQTHTHGPTSHS